MILERLTGVDGQPATPPGLYFPYQILDHAAYLARLEQDGGSMVTLNNISSRPRMRWTVRKFIDAYLACRRGTSNRRSTASISANGMRTVFSAILKSAR